MSVRVRIRVDALDKIAIGQGLRTRYAIAKRLGVSQSTVGRVLDGEQLPGNPFIAATLSTLDVQFDEVFEIEDSDETLAHRAVA